MRLYLVRHGKAEPGTDDARRRLTDEGRKKVERVARRLAAAGIQVQQIKHSGLTRAEETAEILARALGGEATAAPGLGSSDNVAAAARELQGADEGSVMLVGHVPFMHRLASYLLVGDADADVLHFKTGAVACLSNSEGLWIVEWFLPPDLA